MKLSLTELNLRRMKELKDPNVEDVLNFIYDFCHDIKDDTGRSVDSLALGDEDALFRRLPWLGRTVSKIGEGSLSEIRLESRKDKISEMEGKILVLNQELERSEEESRELAQRQKQLAQADEQLRQSKHQAFAVMEEINRLQAQMDELNRVDEAALAVQRDAALAKVQEREAALVELRAAITETEQQEAALAEEQRQAEAALAAKIAEFDQQKARAEALCQEMLAEFEQQKAQMLTEIDAGKQQAENEKQKRLAEVENYRMQTEAEKQAMLTEIDRQRALAETEKQTALAALEEQKAQVSALQTQKEELLKASAVAAQQIQDLNDETEQQRKELEEKQLAFDAEAEKFREMGADQYSRRIERLSEQTRQLQSLAEKINRDWNSGWGQDRQYMNGQPSLPPGVVLQYLNDLQERLRQYRQNLQEAAAILSSPELRV